MGPRNLHGSLLMKTILNLIPVIITGGSFAVWLNGSQAHAAIESAVSGAPPDIVALIQQWGIIITIGLIVIGGLATKIVTGIWEVRRNWQQQQDKFDDERRQRRALEAKTDAIVVTQERHDEEIKQVSAALPQPVPTIDAPKATQKLL